MFERSARKRKRASKVERRRFASRSTSKERLTLAKGERGGGTTKGGAAEERFFGVDWERLRRRIGAVKAFVLILAVATFAGLVFWRVKRNDGGGI